MVVFVGVLSTKFLGQPKFIYSRQCYIFLGQPKKCGHRYEKRKNAFNIKSGHTGSDSGHYWRPMYDRPPLYDGHPKRSSYQGVFSSTVSWSFDC